MKKSMTFITLGCKVNQAESEALASYAEDAGTHLVSSNSSTESCVINTCAVTAKAAMQSRQAIRRAIRKHPDAVIIVTGCYAQMHPEEIRCIQGVDYIIGQADKHRLVDIINAGDRDAGDHYTGGRASAGRKNKPISPIVHDESLLEQRAFSKMPAPAFGNRTRPFLKIQDGCNSFCTYCIVPYSRGRSRSLQPEQVMTELKALTDLGAKEIVLTGIHLGRWGMDLPGSEDLASLLQNLLAVKGLHRLRLSSLEPTEINDRLLDIAAGSSKICRHFHIPLQSGDPGILKRMNRRYQPEQFAETINRIHERFEDAAIGADVMAGFPGETESAFENTRQLIEGLPISYLHVFPFSPRPPAPAANYPDQVPPGAARKRTEVLAKLSETRKSRFYKKMTGRVLTVLTEKRIDSPDFCSKGLSSNYIPVYIEGNNRVGTNQIVDCKVTRTDGHHSVSAIIHKKEGKAAAADPSTGNAGQAA